MTCIERNVPFFCFRRPGQPIRIGIQTSPLKPLQQPVSLSGSQGFVVVPFGDSAPYYLLHEDLTVNVEQNNLEEKDIPTLSPVKNKGKKTTKEISRDDYIKKVTKAIDAIKSGKLNKVVYSHPELVKGNLLPEVTSILNKLITAYPHAYVAMVNLPGEGLWVCATPELLLSRNGQDLQTIALAGTRAIQVDGTPWDDKNKEEQQIVERYIVNTLQPFCTTIKVTPVTTTKAGHLEHLLTRIGMKMPQDQMADKLLSALHPTPAVCGTPKHDSYANILANEGYDREFYSGFLGMIDDKEHFSLYVNLRCMKLTADGTTLFAGGGITADSVPISEWEETKMKIETLKRFLV